MNYYIDVLIKPDAEMRINVLLNTIYTKLHKVLCDLGAKNIGVSFPNYNVTLGNIVRIHGEQMALDALQERNWIGGISGYCEISTIKMVPKNAKYRTVSRKQTTMSQAKLRRLMNRGSITEGEVKQYKTKMFTHGIDNPYLELNSNSSGQKYRRYIEFGDLKSNSTSGPFDYFGLSKIATVPWF